MASKIIGYVALAAVIAAVLWARRNGRKWRTESHAASYAEGRASVHAELTAAATSGVDVGGIRVHVDNRSVSLGNGSTDHKSTDYDDRTAGIVAAYDRGELRARNLRDDPYRVAADRPGGSVQDPARHGALPVLDDARSVPSRRFDVCGLDPVDVSEAW